MVCNWILYSVNLAWQWQKSQSLSCQNCSKSRIICYAKNVENHAIFVEGFWPEFHARGRFMKYSMSANNQGLSVCIPGLLFVVGCDGSCLKFPTSYSCWHVPGQDTHTGNLEGLRKQTVWVFSCPFGLVFVCWRMYLGIYEDVHFLHA